MSSVTLDLPQEVLEAAARLAQQRNIPRSEVFSLAIGAWSRVAALEVDLDQARTEAGRQAGRLIELARDLEEARAGTERLSAEREEARAARDEAVKACRSLEAEISPLRAALQAAREESARLRREAAASAKRAEELEELDRKKVVAVMRDAEVAKLRAHAQDLVVGIQKLEKEVEYKKLEGKLCRDKLEATSRRLAASEKLRKTLEARRKRMERDSFASDREIGGLLRERAKLREELRRLARIINKGLARPEARKPRKPQPPPRKETDS